MSDTNKNQTNKRASKHASKHADTQVRRHADTQTHRHQDPEHAQSFETPSTRFFPKVVFLSLLQAGTWPPKEGPSSVPGPSGTLALGAHSAWGRMCCCTLCCTADVLGWDFAGQCIRLFMMRNGDITVQPKLNFWLRQRCTAITLDRGLLHLPAAGHAWAGLLLRHRLLLPGRICLRWEFAASCRLVSLVVKVGLE